MCYLILFAPSKCNHSCAEFAAVVEGKYHDQRSTADARWNLCYEVSI
jgi:hypothetical protein